MNKLDIEVYLDGTLSEEALEAFEQEMRGNPSFEKAVEQQRKARQYLRTHFLREHVAATLSEKSKQRSLRWWLLAGVGLILFVAVFFRLSRPQMTNTPAPVEQSPAPPPLVPNNLEQEKEPLEPVPVPKSPEKTPPPIAYNKPSDLRPPAYPSPQVRGQQRTDTPLNTLLDKIWYTRFPPRNTIIQAPFSAVAQLISDRDFTNAFVQLEMLEQSLPENDTLRLMKGYCLLEMGEGGEALRYFDKLEQHQAGWTAYLEWHRCLGLLSAGEPEKAMPMLRKIAARRSHPYQQHSKKAMDLLK